MSSARILSIALALTLLAGCGGTTSEPSKKDEAAATADAKARGRDTDKTVFDDMIQTEDRARAVEGVTMGAKANLDKAIDAETSNDASDRAADDQDSAGQ
jgi:hypothetical protein